MRISGIGGQMSQVGGFSNADPETKSFQKQIAEKQKQLQELSSNQEMSMEEKMKKRQDIQKEITDLKNQLRQHQIEQRKEQQQQKSSVMDDMLGSNKKEEAQKQEDQGAGISQTSMKAMITADSAINQAKVCGGVASDMEGTAKVLASEIKADAGRGSSVEKKQQELAEVEKRAEKAVSSQVSELAEASETMEDAAKETEQTDMHQKEEDAKSGKQVEPQQVSLEQQESKQELYVPIDIRL